MRVYVYFNLHKKLWSVKALEGEHKGRVILHTTSLQLSNCVFKVSEAGRQRVLRERCKNVHAGIIGRLDPVITDDIPCPRPITYDPYKYSTFIDAATKEPQFAAPRVVFEGKSVRAALAAA